MNCNNCGSPLEYGKTHCQFCGFDNNKNTPVMANPEIIQENYVLGTIGALVGALLGGGLILLLGQLGFIAGVAGLALSYCTLKGYKLLGKGMGIYGIILTAILALAVPYFANRLDWALSLAQLNSEYTLPQMYGLIPEFIKGKVIEGNEYYKALGLNYLFVAVSYVRLLKYDII